jgi:predicted nucleic acid-binding protein
MGIFLHTVKFYFFDASILVKLFIDEPGSNEARELLGKGTCQTTRYCQYEAYGVIKRKWKKKEIDDEKYFHAIYIMSSFFRDKRIKLVENSLENLDDLREAQRLVAQYPRKVDLSDALQIVSMKKGFFRLLGGESRPVLATVDEKLAKVAKEEGLKAVVI